MTDIGFDEVANAVAPRDDVAKWRREAALEFPDVLTELRRTIIDITRQAAPSTVLGVLIARGEAMTPETIAGTLDLPLQIVGWTLDMLEGEGLVVRFEERGLDKVLAFAPYSTTGR